MKVLLINGSPRRKDCTYTALSEISKVLASEGVESEIVNIDSRTRGCIACSYCMTHDKCIENDGVNVLASRLDEFDGVIVGSPVYYASPNGSLISFLDRLFYSSGKKLTGKPAAAVVSARRAGTTASLEVINKYFSINQMPIVTSNYWTMVHGNSPEEVLQDLEGLQILRILAKNMAWMLKCIDAGKKIGITKPETEQKICTNFIR